MNPARTPPPPSSSSPRPTLITALFPAFIPALIATMFAPAFPAAVRDAAIDVDNTCAACSRRVNDSVNVFLRRAIRVDQAGYRPDQDRKIAYAAVDGGGEFRVVDADGRAAFTGTLQRLGTQPRPKLVAKGFSNSVTPEYTLETAGSDQEDLHLADFSALRIPGRYRIACGPDTSAPFLIHDAVYDAVLEKVLFFFGANRCGATDSWLHGACHLKDGSALGDGYAGSLSGGWHDCGDHGKYASTTAYTALVLSLGHAIWPDRVPDRHGKSHADTTPDGIPDMLAEAKVGADYIHGLYAASKQLGRLDSGDMFHSVGNGPVGDHAYWGPPERQDDIPPSRGGPDRPVSAGIGANIAGSYAASLALFSASWKGRDPAYARALLEAAEDIYDRIVVKQASRTTFMPCCYSGRGPTADDEAMAALALWYATGDGRFGHDLLEKIAPVTFHHGGWTTDYETAHAFVLFGLAKLILPDPATAARYGLSAVVRDSLHAAVRTKLERSIRDGSNGSDASSFPGIKVDQPYHGVFTSADWGFNRYNLGIVTELFMYHDLAGSRAYGEVGLDNIHYLLGANPFDVSFVIGCGDRNLQHPHHRAANPDGRQPDVEPYPYRAPTGAVLGGTRPGKTLMDEWENYVHSESCIDFSAQALFPLLMLSRGDVAPVSIGGGKVAPPGSAAAIRRKGRAAARDALGRIAPRTRSGGPVSPVRFAPAGGP